MTNSLHSAQATINADSTQHNHFFTPNAIAIASQSQSMSSANADADADAPRRECRNREMPFPAPSSADTSKDTAAVRPQTNTRASSLSESATSKISLELQDLRVDDDDADDASTRSVELQGLHDADDDDAGTDAGAFTSTTSTRNLVPSTSSSWYKTRSHLLFAEEIIASLEKEAMMQAAADPFAKVSNYSVGANGFVSLSSLLSDDGGISSNSKITRRSSMNRAA